MLVTRKEYSQVYGSQKTKSQEHHHSGSPNNRVSGGRGLYKSNAKLLIAPPKQTASCRQDKGGEFSLNELLNSHEKNLRHKHLLRRRSKGGSTATSKLK
jgi:hypothetical protein